METRKIRDLTVVLPGDEAEDLDLLAGAPRDKATVVDRRIDGDSWARAKFAECTIARCWFSNADLASIDITDTVFERCVFRGSSLIGAHFTNCTVKNVIFENCRFDYATLLSLRTTGPVAFIGCSLTETMFDRCKLNTAAFDGCKLNASSFLTCDLRGADFRGNDLSKTIGVTQSFRGTVISEVQVVGFTDAITRELEMLIKPERPVEGDAAWPGLRGRPQAG